MFFSCISQLGDRCSRDDQEMSRGLGVDVIKGNTLKQRTQIKVIFIWVTQTGSVASSVDNWMRICYMYLVILMNEGGRDFLPKDLPEDGISPFSSHLVRDAQLSVQSRSRVPYSIFPTCSLGTRPCIRWCITVNPYVTRFWWPLPINFEVGACMHWSLCLGSQWNHMRIILLTIITGNISL